MQRTFFTALIVMSMVVSGSIQQVEAATVNNGQSINTVLSQAQPGDIIYLEPGTYSEIIDFTVAGSKDALITLAAQQPGTVTIEHAQTIEFDQPYWSIEGIIFDHKDAASDAFAITADNLNFDSIELHNGSRNGFDVAADVKGLVITNSEIYDFVWSAGNDAHCIVLDAGASEVLIKDSTIYNCGGNGIELFAASTTSQVNASHNILIEGNTMYTTLSSEQHTNAINIKNGNVVTIRDNVMYGFDDQVIVVQKGSYEVSIVGNTIYSSDRGIEVRAEDGGVPTKTSIEYNVLYDILGQYALKFDLVNDVRVYHNTLYNVTNPIRVEGEGILSGVVYNNLAAASDQNKIIGPVTAQVGYNGWFGVDAEGLVQDTDIVGSDAMFVDASAADFALQVSSPAKKQGYGSRDLGAFAKNKMSWSQQQEQSRAQQIKRIQQAAQVLVAGLFDGLLTDMGVTRNRTSEENNTYLLDKIGVDTSQKTYVDFITYGTVDSQHLGAGERAGVVDSFKHAFGYAPQSQTDWEDVLKIASGRWPSQTVDTIAADQLFKLIYHRDANLDNSHDSSAIAIMTYGLRPQERNVLSEAAAIVTFEQVFSTSPTSARDWNVVRAIAYSGAVR